MRAIILSVLVFPAAILAQNPGPPVYGPCSAQPTGAMNGFVLTATSSAALPTCSWESAGAASVTEAAIANSEWLTSVAGTNTITGSTVTSYASYAGGFAVRFVPANTNTGATTININGVGAKAVTKSGATALSGGELVAGTAYFLMYDGTQFQIAASTGGGGGGGSFSALTSGTNTAAAMLVGTGASMAASGSGSITATAAPLTGITGFGTNVETFLTTPTSANLAAALTNETGTGVTVFNTNPTLIGPALGTPTSGDLTNEINLPVSTGISGLGTGVAAALAAAASGSGGICLSSMSLCGGSNPNIISNTGTATAPIFAVSSPISTAAMTLTADVTTPISVTGLTSGFILYFQLTEGGTVHTAGPAVAPTGFGNWSGPALSANTVTQFVCVNNSGTVTCSGAGSTATSGQGATSSAPITPPSGYLFSWADSTDLDAEWNNSAGSVFAGFLKTGNCNPVTGLCTVISGITVSGTPSTGQVLTATSPSAANWQSPTGGGGSSAYTTVTFSATPTFTVTASTTVQDFQITLTGNVTSSTLNLTSATTGQDIGIKICQDGTGGRTFAWPSNVIGFGAITTTLSQCSKQIFRYDGTNAVAFGPMVNDGATPGIQTSSGFLTLPTAPDTIAGIAATQTLTNKSIDGSEINSGTLPNARIAGLPNANLANSSVTYNGQAVALGATGNVNNGATAHSVALNEGAGAAIAGATIGTAGRILIDQGAAADPAFEVASGSCTVAANGAFTCSGGAGGGGLSGWSNASPASFTVTATQYAPFAGGGNTSGTGAESTVQNKASAAATITGVQCSLNAAFGAGASAVITLRDGAASQTPICTIAAGGTVGVSSGAGFAIASGDLVDWQIATSGTVTNASPQVIITYSVGTSGVGITGCANGLTASSANCVMSRTVRTVTGTDSMSATDCGNIINSTSTTAFTETWITAGILTGCTVKYTNGAAQNTNAAITHSLASTAVFTGLGQGNSQGASSASVYFLFPGNSLDFTFDGTNWNISGSGVQTIYAAYSTSAGNCLSTDGGSYTIGITTQSCTNAGTSITAFPLSSYTLPAYFIGPNTRIRVDHTIAGASSSTQPSSTGTVKLGSTVVYASVSAATSNSAVNLSATFTYFIEGTVAPGSSANVEVVPGYRNASLISWAGGAASSWFASVATNGTLAATLSNTWATATAGNTYADRKVVYTWESF